MNAPGTGLVMNVCLIFNKDKNGKKNKLKRWLMKFKQTV